MNKTEWYPGSMKPVREGVYERKTLYFSKWRDGVWYWGSHSIDEAAAEKTRSPYQSDLPWRGLMQDPDWKIIAVAGVPRATHKGEIEVLMSDTTIKRMRMRDLCPEDWADGVDGSYRQGWEFLTRKEEVA